MYTAIFGVRKLTLSGSLRIMSMKARNSFGLFCPFPRMYQLVSCRISALRILRRISWRCFLEIEAR